MTSQKWFSFRSSARLFRAVGLLWLLGIGACQPPPADSLYPEPGPTTVTSLDGPASILFVGNSFTYYNDGIDRHFAEMLSAGDAQRANSLQVARIAFPDRTFDEHLRSRELRDALQGESWDLVILQAASYEPARITTVEAFHSGARDLAELVRRHGAEPAFLMTWPYRFQPGMIEALAGGYTEAGQENAALIIPAGLAWVSTVGADTIPTLYSDLKHPSLAGTYLAASVVYAAVVGASPEDSTYTAGLDECVARALRQRAWRVVRDYHDIPEKGPEAAVSQ